MQNELLSHYSLLKKNFSSGSFSCLPYTRYNFRPYTTKRRKAFWSLIYVQTIWRHGSAVAFLGDRGPGSLSPGRCSVWHKSSWRRLPLALPQNLQPYHRATGGQPTNWRTNDKLQSLRFICPPIYTFSLYQSINQCIVLFIKSIKSSHSNIFIVSQALKIFKPEETQTIKTTKSHLQRKSLLIVTCLSQLDLASYAC